MERESSSLFDPLNVSAVPVHKHAHDTEAAAADRIAPVAGKLRRQVLAWIKEAGSRGLTGKELGRLYAANIGREPNDASARYSVMPRATELRQAGLIQDSGQRREGSLVWVVTGGQ